MMKPVHISILFVFYLTGLILGMPAFGWAEEASSDVFELGEVVVTAPPAGTESIVATTTITAEEIKQEGARTLDEALTFVPGLYLRTAGQGIPRLDIRGMRTRQVKVLINGVPINSPFDNQFDPSLISVENIAMIKVTRGDSSVLYGADGNAGVINIITKKARPGIHGSVNAEAGQHDEYLGRGYVSFGSGKVNVFVSGTHLQAHDFPLPHDFTDTELQSGDSRVNSDKKRDDFYGNIMYTPSADTQLALTLNAKQADYGIPPDTVSDPFTNNKPEDLSKLNYRRIDDKEGLSTQLSFAHHFACPLSLRGWTYSNTLDQTENQYDDITFTTQAKSGYSDDQDTDKYGADVQIAYDFKEFGTLTSAMIAERGKFKSNYQDKPDKNGEFTYTDDATEAYSASVEYAVSPVNPLGLVLGYGYHRQNRDDAGGDENHSYFAGLHIDVLKNTRLKGSVARKIRFPSLRELYDPKNGNTDLNAETTQHYEVGVEQRIPSAATVVDLTGFRINASDFIEKDEATNRMTNFESYMFRGIEASISSRIIENLYLRTAYTHLDAENRSPNAAFETLEYRPENTFYTQATYLLGYGITGYASYLFVDQRAVYDKKVKHKTDLDDYEIVDVKLSKSFLDNSLDFYVGARNLFDECYAESYSLVQEGRSIYGGVEYSF